MLAVLGLLLLAAKPVPGAAQVDRARIIGAPTFESPRPDGLYVWLEDGAFHLLFHLAPAKKGRTFKAQIVSKDPVTRLKRPSVELAVGASGATYLTATLPKGAHQVEAAFKAQADLTLSEVEGPTGPIPIFLGPLAEPGASKVTIGTFTPFRAQAPP